MPKVQRKAEEPYATQHLYIKKTSRGYLLVFLNLTNVIVPNLIRPI